LANIILVAFRLIFTPFYDILYHISGMSHLKVTFLILNYISSRLVTSHGVYSYDAPMQVANILDPTVSF